MYRQVRFRGPVEAVSREESAAYFASRPRGSQLASRASHQSQPIGSRAELEALVAAEEARWPDTGSPGDVPLPDYWGGWRIRPVEVEFWVGQPSRLHDRMRYRLRDHARRTCAFGCARRLAARAPPTLTCQPERHQIGSARLTGAGVRSRVELVC